MIKVSGPSLVYVAITLIAAASVHVVYLGAEQMVRSGRLKNRQYAVIPGLLLIVTAVGAGLEWLDSHDTSLLQGAAFSAFLGLNVGRLIPRPNSRQR